MQQNENCSNKLDFSAWFDVKGDVDDFIFYCENPEQSEK